MKGSNELGMSWQSTCAKISLLQFTDFESKDDKIVAKEKSSLPNVVPPFHGYSKVESAAKGTLFRNKSSQVTSLVVTEPVNDVFRKIDDCGTYLLMKSRWIRWRKAHKLHRVVKSFVVRMIGNLSFSKDPILVIFFLKTLIQRTTHVALTTRPQCGYLHSNFLNSGKKPLKLSLHFRTSSATGMKDPWDQTQRGFSSF